MKTHENRLSIREGLNPRKYFEGYDFTNTFSFFGVSVGGVAVAIPGFSGPTTGVDTFGFLGSFVEGKAVQSVHLEHLVQEANLE